MTLNELVIAIIFRIINFAIVLLIFAYLFWSKALPVIKEKIKQKKQELSDLQQQQENLLKQHALLEKEIKDQDIFIRLIFEKIERWRSSFNREQNSKQLEHKILEHKILQNSKIRQRELEIHAFKEAVGLQAIRQAKEKLQDIFSDSSQGKRYVSTIIHDLTKSNV